MADPKNEFEDAEFDDLDTLEDDDLGDENWDDDGTATGAEDDLSGDLAADDAGGPTEKTFVQKNFMLIVGAVVVVFGGIGAVAFLGGGDKAPAAVDQAANPDGDALPNPVTEVTDSEMPPMPAPIEGQPSEDGALTPMPTPQELANAELPALEVEEIPAEKPSGTAAPGEAPFDFNENPAPDEQPAQPAGTSDQDGSDNVNAADNLIEGMKDRMQTANPDGSPAASSEVSAQLQAEEEGVAPAPVLDTSPSQEAPAAEPAAQVPDLTPQLEEQKKAYDTLKSESDARIAELEKKLSAAESNATASQGDSQKAAEQAVAAKEKEIGELESRIADLEEKLAASEEKANAAKSAPTAAAPKDEPAPAPVAEAKPETKPAAKPAAKPATPKTSVSTASSWQLKGAMPGKAVLYSSATGDTRTVGVGDSVDGLGKITSVANENGRWTVRGTKGSVAR